MQEAISRGMFTALSMRARLSSVTDATRIELILKNSLVPISKRQIQMALPDVSIHTVDAVIKKMIAEGRAEKVGGFRNARYRFREGEPHSSATSR